MTDYPRADKWQRPLIRPRGEDKAQPHTRSSTLAKTLEDANTLLGWYGTFAAYGAVSRPDLAAKLASLWPWREETKKELKLVTEEMKNAAGGSAGANMGDALHSMVHRINLGEDFKPLPQFEPDLKAYSDLLDRHGIEIVPGMAEQTVVIEGLSERVAGSFDMIVAKGGRNYIADLKTGQKLDYGWPAIAVQLALYSRATSIYDWADDSHHEMPVVDQDVGLVVHLPSGSAHASLHVVDLEAGWSAVPHALWARAWRNQKVARPAKQA